MVRVEQLVLAVLVFAFGVSMFRGIERPLLWNDEATTAIFARSLINYGHPRAHGPKNNLNPTIPEDKGLCIKEETDTYICTGWGHYFVAAPGVYLAEMVDDIYLKTWLVRLPFAGLGFLGIVVFSMIIWKFVREEKYRYWLVSGFYLIELLSVYYALHVREVRYYSIVIFVTGLLILLYTQRRIIGEKNRFYYLSLPLSVFLFVSYHPSYFVLFGSIFLFEVLRYFLESNYKFDWGFIGTWVISGILVLPLIWYFEIFYVSSEYGKFLLRRVLHVGSFSVELYLRNLALILEFFVKEAALFSYLVLVGMVFYLGLKDKKLRTVLKDREVSFLFFLGIYVVLYLLFVSRIPFLFSRYFLVLQPVISVSIFVGVYYLFRRVSFDKSKIQAICIVFVFTYLISFIFRLPKVGGYVYQLTHEYKGPLDYVILDIKDRFEDPSELVIATNYEELTYVFYLNSRVIVGGVGNNLEEDMKETPDVIIVRRAWGYKDELNELLSRAEYGEIVYPVYDYEFNNIAEPSRHLFKTKYAEREENKLKMYVREYE